MRPFDELCAKEPRLRQLEEKILGHWQKYANAEWYCAPLCWYGYGPEGEGFKDMMRHLVGYSATNPELRDERSYNIATWHLQALLPPCRNCHCKSRRSGAVME